MRRVYWLQLFPILTIVALTGVIVWMTSEYQKLGAKYQALAQEHIELSREHRALTDDFRNHLIENRRRINSLWGKP